MSTASTLYDRDLLRLALDLARYPLLAAPDGRANVQSPVCGSRMTVDVELGPHDRVTAVGLRAHACAVGQAAAAIFAGGATGRDPDALAQAAASVQAWLTDDAPLPDWPGLDAIAAVRAYHARHGAALLPFRGGAEAAARARDGAQAA